MSGPFLTLQFSTQTTEVTSTSKDYGLRTRPGTVNLLSAQIYSICVCFSALLVGGGSRPIIFNLSQFFSTGTLVMHNLFSCVPCHTYMQTLTHMRTHTVSLPLSAVLFGEWSQSVDTGGSQLCPSCLGVTVVEFSCNYSLQSADRRSQQVMGHPHTAAAAARLNAERNEVTVNKS